MKKKDGLTKSEITMVPRKDGAFLLTFKNRSATKLIRVHEILESKYGCALTYEEALLIMLDELKQDLEAFSLCGGPKNKS